MINSNQRIGRELNPIEADLIHISIFDDSFLPLINNIPCALVTQARYFEIFTFFISITTLWCIAPLMLILFEHGASIIFAKRVITQKHYTQRL